MNRVRPYEAPTRSPYARNAGTPRPVAHRLRRRPGDDSYSPAVRLAERLIAETRDEVRRADEKATHWLSVLGGAALALVTALTGQSWLPSDLRGADRWTWWTGCLCAALATLALVLALVPRTGGDENIQQVGYFGHVHQLGDPTVVRLCLERAARDSMPGLVGELCWISRLAMTKYRYTRLGTGLSALAAGLISTSLL
ncbi:hypothetical protein BDK92_1518 [Micromonospora pisi]|uniref:Pycsar effector protein domain-containing protein n=1 Tax=Micromonospora pisi TaxID=589240 RepID=A0A495JFT8_9ACTN|nr:Pycsar system effector family protein [Micromonospora pisi]RKR87244.1 hypothetical protein BDK92_1518 [Micromonospora pisi]